MPLSPAELEQFINSTAINTVKIAVKNLIDIFEDNWAHIIRQELSFQFTDKSYKKLRPLVTREFNLIKRVVNERSLTYKNPSKRVAVKETVGKDDQGNDITTETPDKTYEDIKESLNLDNIMSQVEKYTNLTNHTLLKIVWRDGKLDFDVLTFDNAQIFTDPEDWKRIIAIKYFLRLDLPNFDITDQDFRVNQEVETNRTSEQELPSEKFLFSFLWTIEEDGKKGKIYKFEQKEGKEHLIETKDNPYRDQDGNVIFPFILFSKEVPIQKLLNFTSGDDLFDANLNIALNMIHLNELIKYQSYKQIVMKTKNLSKDSDKLELDAMTILKLKVDQDGFGDITTLDLETAIDKLWNIIRDRAIMILSQYGISPANFTLSKIPESGIAIQLDNRQLLEDREAVLPRWRNKEKETFSVIRIVWNHHNPNNLIDTKAIFKIDFGEVSFPKSAQEESIDKTVKITNNVITPVDWIMQENPDLTREEAEKIFERNKALNTQQRVTLQPTKQPGQETKKEEE